VPLYYILFWDQSDIELKAPEDCVRAEENDGIYFRVYTEELVVGSQNVVLFVLNP